MILTPAVNDRPPLVMRTLDGRTYTVRTRADVRVMAADLYRMVAGYQIFMRDAYERLYDAAWPTDYCRAWFASLQASCGDVMQLCGELYATGDPAWSSRPTDATVRPVSLEGVLYPVDSPERMKRAGEQMARAARAVWQSSGMREQNVASAPQQLESWLPQAHDTGNMRALPVVAVVGIWTIGIVAGALTVVSVVRAALAWYAPEGAARLEAYKQGLDAIEEQYQRDLERCAQLPENQRADCEQRALDATLERLDQVNRRARSTIGETVQKLALVAGGLGALYFFVIRRS